jgi:hypothetical protein
VFANNIAYTAPPSEQVAENKFISLLTSNISKATLAIGKNVPECPIGNTYGVCSVESRAPIDIKFWNPNKTTKEFSSSLIDKIP